MPILSDEDYYFLKTLHLRRDNEQCLSRDDYTRVFNIEDRYRQHKAPKWLYDLRKHNGMPVGNDDKQYALVLRAKPYHNLLKDYEDAHITTQAD